MSEDQTIGAVRQSHLPTQQLSQVLAPVSYRHIMPSVQQKTVPRKATESQGSVKYHWASLFRSVMLYDLETKCAPRPIPYMPHQNIIPGAHSRFINAMPRQKYARKRECVCPCDNLTRLLSQEDTEQKEMEMRKKN